MEVGDTSTLPAQTVLHVGVQTSLLDRAKWVNVVTITRFIVNHIDYIGHIATVSTKPVNSNALIVLGALLLVCNPREVNPWFVSPVLDCLRVDCSVVCIVIVSDLLNRIDVECCHHKSHKLHETP